jgi:hypothetical protein
MGKKTLDQPPMANPALWEKNFFLQVIEIADYKQMNSSTLAKL